MRGKVYVQTSENYDFSSNIHNECGMEGLFNELPRNITQI